jgi:S1-C subfamily serine protease
MDSSLISFSNDLAAIVEQFSSQVVAVHARRHVPSSGLRWRSDVVVTAEHTIERDEDIRVSLADGSVADAELIGRDPGTDLALLRVKQLASSAQSPIPVEEVLRAGDLAVVLGRSPDSGVNASLGIISAVSGPWRTWRGGRMEQYVRLDARLFPNSSGGAVISASGRLVGLATSALSRIAGLGIPASTINRVAQHLLEKGFVPRGYVGVGVQPVPVPHALRAKIPLGNETGLIVLSVEPDGPADKAGLLIGDLMVGIGDSRIENIGDLQAISDSARIGASVKASFIRAGVLKEAALVIGERPGRRG